MDLSRLWVPPLTQQLFHNEGSKTAEARSLSRAASNSCGRRAEVQHLAASSLSIAERSMVLLIIIYYYCYAITLLLSLDNMALILLMLLDPI
jgi:hypothetical protein